MTQKIYFLHLVFHFQTTLAFQLCVIIHDLYNDFSRRHLLVSRLFSNVPIMFQSQTCWSQRWKWLWLCWCCVSWWPQSSLSPTVMFPSPPWCVVAWAAVKRSPSPLDLEASRSKGWDSLDQSRPASSIAARFRDQDFLLLKAASEVRVARHSPRQAHFQVQLGRYLQKKPSLQI